MSTRKEKKPRRGEVLQEDIDFNGIIWVCAAFNAMNANYNALGGSFVTRDCLRFRPQLQIHRNGNDYGDTVAKISGVYCLFTIIESVIYTRTNDYKIAPKCKPLPVENLILEGSDALPWRSINNYTGSSVSTEKPPSEKALSVDNTASDDSSVTQVPLII